MCQIKTFTDCLEIAKEASNKRKHILLGNGFSIAYDSNIFNYASLYDKSKEKLGIRINSLFAEYNTYDFETVIKNLQSALHILSVYKINDPTKKQEINIDINKLKEQLIDVLTETHPESPEWVGEDKLSSCSNFIDLFNNIYTLNYDMLLYWSILKNTGKKNCSDGFRQSLENESIITWNINEDHNQNIYYLHGALHLFNSYSELEKLTWSRTGIKLKDQITEKINNDIYPLVITGASSQEKMAKIKESAYLHRGLKSLHNIMGNLFVYGHSLDMNDQHIYASLSPKLDNIFISLYGDIKSLNNQKIINNAEIIKEQYGLKAQLHFYDAKSVSIWENIKNPCN